MPDTGIPAETIAASKELLDRARLENVRCSSLSARLEPGDHRRPTVEVEVAIESSYACAPGYYGNRFGYRVRALDGLGEAIAVVEFELIVDFSVSDDEFEPTGDAARFVMETTGLFGAFPYARELLQNSSARLQLNPIVFDLLDRNHLMPRGANVVPDSPPVDQPEDSSRQP